MDATSSSTILISLRYTGFNSWHTPSASCNCSCVARRPRSARAARVSRLVSPSAIAPSMRRALAPSRSETRLDSLMCASSSRASNRLCNCTRLRVSWYLVRTTVRHRRCSTSGTKLRTSSWATRRFTKRSASRKSFWRPRRPRFDCACARWSVPDVASAPSRVWQICFQYRSRVPQTGFQYCAVDSITTSWTCCSSSHAANERSASGKLPKMRRVKSYSPSTWTSETTTCSILLCTSIPAILYDMVSPCGRSGEHGSRYFSQGRELSPLIRMEKRGDAQSFAQHACSGSDIISASASPLRCRPRRSGPLRILTLTHFHKNSRAEGPPGHYKRAPVWSRFDRSHHYLQQGAPARSPTHAAGDQNRSSSINWAAKQEKLRP